MVQKYALTEDGSLYSWGCNLDGSLGYQGGNDGYEVSPMLGGETISYQNEPKRVDFSGAVEVASNGMATMLVLKEDGTVWAIGRSYMGNACLPDQSLKEFTQVMSGVARPGGTAEQPSSWARAEVDAALAAGIVPQALRSRYTQPATRAEFCALGVALYETVTGREITGRTAFQDTDDVNVEKLASLNVVGGVGDNRFDPDGLLTREQAAALLSRLAEAMGRPLAAREPGFADSGAISGWALSAVGQMQAAQIMGGVGDNRFDPAGSYTREQSIISMLRLYEAAG